MGTACVPSGKRLVLPRKMSTTWVLLKLVIALAGETIATTSAATGPTARLSARPKMARNPTQFIPATIPSPHEINRDAQKIHRAAGVKSRLNVDQHARGTPPQVDAIVLQLEVHILHEIPPGADRNGILNRG